MKFAETCNEIFDRATATYHIADRVDAPYQNPYPKGSIEAILFDKNWIDVNQWHMEDIIRDPDIKPEDAVKSSVASMHQTRSAPIWLRISTHGSARNIRM